MNTSHLLNTYTIPSTRLGWLRDQTDLARAQLNSSSRLFPLSTSPVSLTLSLSHLYSETARYLCTKARVNPTTRQGTLSHRCETHPNAHRVGTTRYRPHLAHALPHALALAMVRSSTSKPHAVSRVMSYVRQH